MPSTPTPPEPRARPDWPQLIVNGLDEALFAVDHGWRFMYVNPPAAALFARLGVTSLGDVIWDAFPTLIGSPFEAFYRDAMKSETARRMEDFSPIAEAWYEVRTYPIEQGMIVFLQDTTQRRQLRQSLRESEYRYKTLSEASFEAVVLQQDGLIVETNATAAAMFGYDDVADVLGTPVLNLVAPESRNALQQRLASHANEEYRSLGMYEVIALRKDGSVFPAEARGRSMIYHGALVRVMAIRDISERKQAEQSLARTQAQLYQSQKMESIGQLAGGVAHDFNNLLMAIFGYCELIRDRIDPRHPIASDVLEIEHAAERAAALTRQLLAFSRQQALDPVVLNLNQVVSNMDSLLQRTLGNTIDLVVERALDLGYAFADAHQLEQVILNLAINARDAMPNGGNPDMT